MRTRALLIAAGFALALTGCPEKPPALSFQLEKQADLPTPPTAEAPGLTSDLVPPGFTAGN